VIDYIFRPIHQWPVPFTKNRKRSPFHVGYQRIIDDLDRELGYLGAKACVIQAAVTDAEIRNDGRLRSEAKPQHPGVIVSFESKHGPLSYPCDTYSHWQDNLRAITLAMAALRAVDRYGVTRRGEQYKGWKQLPGGDSPTPSGHMSVEAAASYIVVRGGGNAAGVIASPDEARAAYRRAAQACHPDLHGDKYTADFARLNAAKEIIDRHHGR
jgi:hypothetical protein